MNCYKNLRLLIKLATLQLSNASNKIVHKYNGSKRSCNLLNRLYLVHMNAFNLIQAYAMEHLECILHKRTLTLKLCPWLCGRGNSLISHWQTYFSDTKSWIFKCCAGLSWWRGGFNWYMYQTFTGSVLGCSRVSCSFWGQHPLSEYKFKSYGSCCGQSKVVQCWGSHHTCGMHRDSSWLFPGLTIALAAN